MKKKITITILILLFFTIIFIVAAKDIKGGRLESYSKYLPHNIKVFLKKTIFIVPTLKKTLADKNETIRILSLEKVKTNETWKDISNSNIKKISMKNFFTNKIVINNESFDFNKFLLPLPDYYSWGKKSVGYIDKIDNKIFFVAGDGTIFYFINDDVLKALNKKESKINLYKINNNLVNLVHEDLFSKGKVSVKDILIKNNKIYISHINKKKKNCHNIEIVNGDINYEFIEFKKFFSYDECFINGEVHSTGGRIVSLSENEILFSIGEGLKRRLSQDINSMFGKIFKINIKTNKNTMISMGHRNPQGLHFDKINNIITSTEHGPNGGDEINIIKLGDKVTNYGWPISSYGDHYPGKINKYMKAGKLDELLKEAPLYKSHSQHSFEEPIKYFTPSVGISEIIKLPEDLNINLKNLYLVGSMGNNIYEGDKSLHYFKLNQNKNNIEKIDSVIVNERVRDIKFNNENNLIIMVLENSPSIGFISVKK